MIIELPKEISFEKKYTNQELYIENGILKFTRNISFRKFMKETAIKMKGEKCYYCKKILSEDEASIDHIFPSDFGGPTITNNLVPACKKCNQEKSNMTYRQYMKYLESKNLGYDDLYLKSLTILQEKIRTQKKYQIPKKWITTVSIKQIEKVNILDFEYEETKACKKIQKYYTTYGTFKRPIIVDRNLGILDEVIEVLYARDNNIKDIPTIILENVELIDENKKD